MAYTFSTIDVTLRAAVSCSRWASLAYCIKFCDALSILVCKVMIAQVVWKFKNGWKLLVLTAYSSMLLSEGYPLLLGCLK